MTTLFNKSGFKIRKIKDGLYDLEYETKNEFIFTSLNIQKQIVTKIEKSGKTNVEFRSDSVKTYPQLMARNDNVLSYSMCLQLLLNIGSQCIVLENSGFVYADLDVSNIITFNNGEKFIYLDDVIFEKNSKSSFVLDKLVNKSRFSSPEFLNVTSLPSQLHSNSWIYSLGAIVFHSLTQLSETQSMREQEIMVNLQSIQDTKLYFCILRMLYHNHNMRKFLFI